MTRRRGLRGAYVSPSHVRTHCLPINITLAVPDGVVKRARAVARQQGRSLNGHALVREYLARLPGEPSGNEIADELLRLMREHGGHSLRFRFHA